MGLETGSYIGDLNTANPSGTDPKSQGDDHIRLLKAAARNSFPGFAGVVAGTGMESGSGAAFAVALSPAPAAYAAGMMVVFKATHTNPGAATLQVNALAAKPLKAVDGSALEAGDIEAGAIVAAFYDGSDFFLISGADRAARGGDSYTGAHDFTGAAVQVATAGAGDNSSKAASTAYVDAADALKANLASPALTGVPTAPTAAPGTNTNQVATTAFATQLAFQAALPVQAGQGGKFLQTDGAAASWQNPIASQSEAEAGLASDRLMTAERTAQAINALGRFAPDVIVEDQKTAGTAGNSLVAGLNKCTLNTLTRNHNSVGSISAGALMLPPGEWMLRGYASFESAPPTQTSVGKARLYNATSGVHIAGGQSVSTAQTAAGGQATGQSDVIAIVNLSAQTSVELYIYVTSGGTAGRPAGGAFPEVYARLEATRLSA